MRNKAPATRRRPSTLRAALRRRNSGRRPVVSPSLPNANLTGVTVLQPLVLPDPSLCSEQELYMRLHGPAGFSVSDQSLAFDQGAHLFFNTYFNLFNIGKWSTHCGLKTAGLQLAGQGKMELIVFIAYPDKSWGRLVNEVITLQAGHTQRIEIPLGEEAIDQAVLFFELKPLGKGTLTAAAWDTEDKPRRLPKLALSVTTFRREEAVNQTVEKFKKFVRRSRIGNNLHMFVIDNGRSAGIESNQHVTAIDNQNLGGAGGFARGLIAARDAGHSHCLFMDDDAATPMDALERTWHFLAYARDPATAVAGAMISTRHAWALWENGALFDGACKPLFGGTDLRDPDQVMAMEYSSTARQPHNFYGGWWYFAFPIAEVKHLPFPFFVRGDDVSFSLVHDFNIQTLPGVVSFQESFTEKDSPLTWYLDLRSHLAHHLSLPTMDIGRKATSRIALWFATRALIPAHYETLAAVNLALEDVMRGPNFFADNADMATRRTQIGALRKQELWQKVGTPPTERRRLNPHKRWHRALMKATINGHLLPFFGRFGNHITLPADQRWNPREVWGASRITYSNEGAGTNYTVTHSKRIAYREGLRFLRLYREFNRKYEELKRQYQNAYSDLTGDQFWEKALHIDVTQQAQPASKAAAE